MIVYNFSVIKNNIKWLYLKQAIDSTNPPKAAYLKRVHEGVHLQADVVFDVKAAHAVLAQHLHRQTPGVLPLLPLRHHHAC